MKPHSIIYATVPNSAFGKKLYMSWKRTEAVYSSVQNAYTSKYDDNQGSYFLQAAFEAKWKHLRSVYSSKTKYSTKNTSFIYKPVLSEANQENFFKNLKRIGI